MEILNKEKLKSVLEKWKGHPSITGLMEKFSQLQSYTNKSYKDLQSLRDIVFQGVSVKINKYIEAQKNIFTPNLISAVMEVVPARTEKEIGVAIKPNLLERSTYKSNAKSLKINPI